ncbi:MAG: hypothetical protein J0H94_09135 [Rhizobiales bacterium]|jgi:hypothetical protein|nr:hypothetical protein [Hyphomicrobiales bacterium]
MADYFTQFSCMFDVGTPENARRAIELFQSYSDRLDEEGSTLPGFAFVLDPAGGGTALWIHDDGCGDIGQVTEFVIECAKALGLKGRWGFEWCQTCSRPRTGAFGGGAQVIDLETGDHDTWICTSDWLHRQLAVDAGVRE